jgi:exonuclease 3'-5' domain-containing protein 2
MKYSNNTILDPNGEILCRVGDKKIKWYLNRGLAEMVSAKPFVIKLKFTPNGRGHEGDSFYLQNKENICVKCGATSELTLHHIVPRCYRRHFPAKIKDHDFHDVILLCIECHSLYEKEAQKLKNKINIEYGVNNQTKSYKIAGYEKVLSKYRDSLPKSRIEYLEKLVKEHNDLAGKLICEERMNTDFGKIVVEKLDSIQDFVVRWRKHFIEVMRPGFMPIGWDINRKVKE